MTRTALLALAIAAIALAAPAEARPDARGVHSRPMIDVGAIPAYPAAGPAKAGRQLRRAASPALAGSRRAARSPEGRKAPSRASYGFSTVQTAGGLALTGNPAFVEKAASVIKDLAASGYQPKRVTCLSYSRSHVAGSLHFLGKACDVDQRGWGLTPAPKVVLRLIVARHGLRDGCEFRDSGHFDDGPRLDFRRVLRNCGAAYAAVTMPQQFAAHVKIKIAAR